MADTSKFLAVQMRRSSGSKRTELKDCISRQNVVSIDAETYQDETISPQTLRCSSN